MTTFLHTFLRATGHDLLRSWQNEFAAVAREFGHDRNRRNEGVADLIDDVLALVAAARVKPDRRGPVRRGQSRLRGGGTNTAGDPYRSGG